MTEPAVDDAPPGRRFMGLHLAGTAGAANMLTYYWACLVGILLNTFVPQMQPYLLTEFLGIPEGEQGVVSGDLAFWGEVVIIVMVGVWGTWSDRIGRRPIMVFGFLIMAVGVLLYPRAESFAGLLLARLVFACGAAAVSVMMVTLIADYVADKSRGTASGMMGFFNGVGAMITAMVLLGLPKIFADAGQTPLQAGLSTYWVVFALTVVTCVLMWFGLAKQKGRVEQRESLLTQAREGLLAAKDSGIALAYGASFVARGNLVILGTFLALWLANYGTVELGMSRADAVDRAGLFVGAAYGGALLAAPLWGFLADRVHRVTALCATLFLAFLGYGGTWLIDNPFGAGMIVCCVLIGTSEVGCIVTSSVLIAQQSPQRIRGSVIGIFNLFGAVGILVASKVGGVLFDDWREAAPFILFGCLALVVLFWGLAVRAKVVPADDSLTT